jgi:hypothetical protein
MDGDCGDEGEDVQMQLHSDSFEKNGRVFVGAL